MARDGSLWAQFFRTEAGYRLRFPGLSDFRVSRDGRDLACEPAPGVSEETIRHLYLNQVLPLALARQGKLVLHASAVDLGGESVAFVGESGRGKSTLAASFSTHGYGFLTDDGLVVDDDAEEIRALPSHPSLRLWDDSREAVVTGPVRISPPLAYTFKARLLVEGSMVFCEESRPLCCVFVLDDGRTGEVMHARLSPREALVELARNSFVLDADTRELLTKQFDRFSRVASRLPFFRLDYPRRFEVLDEVREVVLGLRGR